MHGRLIPIALAIGSLAASRAEAANLITNGGFDDAGSYLTGWLNVGVDESWAADDADGAPDSGSVEIKNPHGDTFTEFIYFCVPVEGGASYSYGAKQKTLSGQTATGEARLVLFFSSDSNCSDSLASAQTTSTAVGDWTSLQDSAQAPPDALGARLLLLVSKVSGGSANDLTVRFDDAFIVPEPGAAALQLSAALALGVLWRRGSA